MAITVDAKEPVQDASEGSDINHMEAPPPERVAEELPHLTNTDPPTTPTIPPVVDKAAITTTRPTNHDPRWRRWMRSRLTISLLFLKCVGIAIGLGLAIHGATPTSLPPYPDLPYEGQGHGQGPGPYGPNGTNLTGAVAGGPWSSSNRTFTFPQNIAHIEFCPPLYFNDSVSLSNVFIFANISVSLPPNFGYRSMDLRSIAQSSHSWQTSIADLTAANISFDKVRLESEEGSIIVQDISARHFTAFSTYGNIYGTVEAADTYNVTSRHGVVSLINRP
ncbi:hypothetical protein FRB90_004632 [Tulasnella sp. 427]|nr:hypothetical protein FRB90_004632 [Tulasnella sp. 427]